ncbi:MAG: helical backbone metal receptor [Pigmentiphaga sp.]|nr:helical backbone metal receptor [Pigmentiphaga sp.]
MQRYRRSLLAAALALPLVRSAYAQTAARPPARVVAAGGSVTELVYALGAGERLVAVDLSSVYPAEALALPKVGYYRDLPIEGVASMRPDLLIASDQSGPPATLQRLRDLGIPVLVVPDAPTLPALQQRIRLIADALGVSNAGEQLTARLEASLAALPPLPDRAAWPKAVSIMAHGNSVLSAGSGTTAHAIMTLAGIDNVMQGQNGYKPAAAESILAAAPDVIITTELSVRAQGGAERLLALPALAITPAARQGRLVVMEDVLYLTFGPRLDEAVTRLRERCTPFAKTT